MPVVPDARGQQQRGAEGDGEAHGGEVHGTPSALAAAPANSLTSGKSGAMPRPITMTPAIAAGGQSTPQ